MRIVYTIICSLLFVFSLPSYAEIREIKFYPEEGGPIYMEMPIFIGIENPIIDSVSIFIDTSQQSTHKAKVPKKVKLNFVNRDSITISNFSSLEENQYFSTVKNFWVFKKVLIVVDTNFKRYDSMRASIKLIPKTNSDRPNFETLQDSGFAKWSGIAIHDENGEISWSKTVQHNGRTIDVALFKYPSIEPSYNSRSIKILASESGKPDKVTYLPIPMLTDWLSYFNFETSHINLIYGMNSDGNRWIENEASIDYKIRGIMSDPSSRIDLSFEYIIQD